MLPKNKFVNSLLGLNFNVKSFPTTITCPRCVNNTGALTVTYYNSNIYIFCCNCQYGADLFQFYIDSYQVTPEVVLERLINEKLISSDVSSDTKNQLITAYYLRQKYLSTFSQLVKIYEQNIRNYNNLVEIIQYPDIPNVGLSLPDNATNLKDFPILTPFLNKPTLIYPTEITPGYTTGFLALTAANYQFKLIPYQAQPEVMNPAALFVHKRVFIIMDLILYLNIIHRNLAEGFKAIPQVIYVINSLSYIWNITPVEDLIICTHAITPEVINIASYAAQYNKKVFIYLDTILNKHTNLQYLTQFHEIGLLSFLGKAANKAEPFDIVLANVVQRNPSPVLLQTLRNTANLPVAVTNKKAKSVLNNYIPDCPDKTVQYGSYQVHDRKDGWYVTLQTNKEVKITSVKLIPKTITKDFNTDNIIVEGFLRYQKTQTPIKLQFKNFKEIYQQYMDAVISNGLPFPVIPPLWRSELLNIGVLLYEPKTIIVTQQINQEGSNSSAASSSVGT